MGISFLDVTCAVKIAKNNQFRTQRPRENKRERKRKMKKDKQGEKEIVKGEQSKNTFNQPQRSIY